jgi:hypothetical protein
MRSKLSGGSSKVLHATKSVFDALVGSRASGHGEHPFRGVGGEHARGSSFRQVERQVTHAAPEFQHLQILQRRQAGSQGGLLYEVVGALWVLAHLPVALEEARVVVDVVFHPVTPCEGESRLLSQRTACRYCPTTHA